MNFPILLKWSATNDVDAWIVDVAAHLETIGEIEGTLFLNVFHKGLPTIFPFTRRNIAEIFFVRDAVLPPILNNCFPGTKSVGLYHPADSSKLGAKTKKRSLDNFNELVTSDLYPL